MTKAFLPSRAQLLASSALGLVRDPFAGELLALEPRMVFDGAGAAIMADVAKHMQSDPAGALHPDSAAQDHTTDRLLEAVAAAAPLPPSPATPREVVFVDSRVEDLDAFRRAAGPDRLVVTVGADEDGLARITETLKGLRGVDAVHIVSHGKDGGLLLGADWVDAAAVGTHARDIEGWRASLTETADLLLYGCDIGAGSAGATLMARLSAASGADVAASTDLTGGAKGADWTLEKSTGAIEARLLTPDGWDHSLAVSQPDPIDVTTGAGAKSVGSALAGLDGSKVEIWLDSSKLTGSSGDVLSSWNNLVTGSKAVGRASSGTGTGPTLEVVNGKVTGVHFDGSTTLSFGIQKWLTEGPVSIFMVMDRDTADFKDTPRGPEIVLGNFGPASISIAKGDDGMATIGGLQGTRDRIADNQVVSLIRYGGDTTTDNKTAAVRFRSTALPDGETTYLERFATPVYPLVLGGFGGASENFKGTIRELVVYRGALSASEARIVENALTQKWGIAPAGAGREVTSDLYKPDDAARLNTSNYNNELGGVGSNGYDSKAVGSNGGLTIDAGSYLSSGSSTNLSSGYIMWGHNGGSLGMSDLGRSLSTSSGTIDKVMGRVWAYQTTGDSGDRLSLSFDTGNPALAPDGLRLLWRNNDSGEWQVVSSDKAVVSTDGKVTLSGVTVGDGSGTFRTGQGEFTLGHVTGVPDATLPGSGKDLVTSSAATIKVAPGTEVRINVDGGGWTAVRSNENGLVDLPSSLAPGERVIRVASAGQGDPVAWTTLNVKVVDASQALRLSLQAPAGLANKEPGTEVNGLKVTTNEIIANTLSEPERRIVRVTPDTAGSYRFTLGDNALYTIDPVTGWISFASGKAPNYEKGADKSQQVQVTISDGVRTVTQTITIELRDKNDAPGIAIAPQSGDFVGVAPQANVTLTFISDRNAGGNAAKVTVDESGNVTLPVWLSDEDPSKDGKLDTFVSRLRLSAGVQGKFVLDDRVTADRALMDRLSISGIGTPTLDIVGKLEDIKALSGSLRYEVSETPAAFNLVATIDDLGNSISGDVQRTNRDIFRFGVLDKPVLDAGQTVTLTATSERPTASSSGIAVSTLVGLKTEPGRKNVADTSTLGLGIAVTQLGGNGTWYVRKGGTGEWYRLTGADAANPLWISAGSELYFQAAASSSGTIANALTYKAWDQFTKSANSLSEATGTVSVRLADERPPAVEGGKSFRNTPSTSDPAQTNVATIGSIVPVSGTGVIGTEVGTITGSPTIGFAVTNATGSGTWWYSTNGGDTWLRIAAGTLGANHALLLSSGTLVFYEPPAGSESGSAPKLTVKAWDTARFNQPASGTFAVSLNDKAFSAASTEVGFVANERPVLSMSGPVHADLSAGPLTTTSGVSTADLLGSKVEDDGLFRGISIAKKDVGYGGQLWYSLDGGVNWQPMSGTSPDGRLFLTKDTKTRIAIVVQPGQTADVSVQFRAWDGSVFAPGNYQYGTELTEAFKTNLRLSESNAESAEKGTVTFRKPANDPGFANNRPVLDVSKDADPARSPFTFLPQVQQGESPNLDAIPARRVSDLMRVGWSAIDRESNAARSIGMAVTAVSEGTLYWRLPDSRSWTAVREGDVSESSALLLPPNALVIFIPTSSDLGGQSSKTIENAVTVKAWDMSSGTAFTHTDTRGTDQTSAFSRGSVTISQTVTKSNAAPSLTLSDSSTLTYVEQQSVVNPFRGATLNLGQDGEDKQGIKSFQITVTGVKDSMETLFVDGKSFRLLDSTRFSGTFMTESGFNVVRSSPANSPTTVTLTFTLPAGGEPLTKAAFERLVQGITFDDPTDNPTAGDRVISFTRLQDDGGVQGTGQDTSTTGLAARTVTVQPVPDAPALSFSRSVSYTEKDPAVPLFANAVVSDPDGGTYTRATIVLDAPPSKAKLTLQGADGFSLSQESARDGTTTYRLTTTKSFTTDAARKSAWEAALKGIKFQTVGDNPPATVHVTVALAESQDVVSETAALDVAITLVNDPPALGFTQNTVDENSAPGTVVGTFTVSDPEGRSVTVELRNLDGTDYTGPFKVSGNKIVVDKAIDYESTKTSSFRLVATDADGGSTTRDVTIAVNDVNEAPTALQLVYKDGAKSVPENSRAGTIVGSLEVTDPDENGTYSFQLLEPGNKDKPFSGPFAIGTDGKSIVVKGDNSLDFETTKSYKVKVRVLDGNLVYDQVITIDVGDVNEAPTAVTLVYKDGASVPENSKAGTTVGTLQVTDPDRGETFRIQLINPDSDDAPYDGPFAIGKDGKSIVVRGDNALDYETTRSYRVKVRVHDRELNFDQVITIAVGDVNEAPTEITLSKASVQENSAAGTVVGQLGSDDPDAGDPGTFVIIGGSDAFVIDGTTLKTTRPLDHEATPTLDVTVRVTDRDGLSFEKTFTIAVDDANEPPSPASLSAVSVLPGVPGATIGTLSAQDPDANTTLTFTPRDGRFEVDGTMLRLKPGTSLEPGTVTLAIDVSDGELTTTGEVTFTVESGVPFVARPTGAPPDIAGLGPFEAAGRVDPFILARALDGFAGVNLDALSRPLVTARPGQVLALGLDGQVRGPGVTGATGNATDGVIEISSSVGSLFAEITVRSRVQDGVYRGLGADNPTVESVTVRPVEGETALVDDRGEGRILVGRATVDTVRLSVEIKLRSGDVIRQTLDLDTVSGAITIAPSAAGLPANSFHALLQGELLGSQKAVQALALAVI